MQRPIDPAARQSLVAGAREALKSGNLDLAAILIGKIDDPTSIDALEVSSLIASARGDDDQAEMILRDAIKIASKRRWPYADLIRLLLNRGRPREAEEVARSALVADPDNADAHAMLGLISSEQNKWFEAAGHFERAIELAGPHPQLLSGLGLALLRRGKLNAARAPLEAAVRADPGRLEPIVYLSELEERLGRFEEAGLQLDRAERIAKASRTDVDLQRSVLLSRMGKTGEALALLDARQDLSGHALLQRGRLRDTLGRHGEAWDDWIKGKEMLARVAGREYPADEVRRQADALAAAFTRDRTAVIRPAARREDVPQPMFILGFPRSGTTLVEQILASHSRIEAGGELPFGSELHELATSLGGGADTFPEGLSRASPDWPTVLRDLYLRRAERYGLLQRGTLFFTDKMPSNDFWLPLLRLAFPASPVILVRRHPLDVLTSVMAHDMTHGFHSGYRLEDAAMHLALVDRLLETYRRNGVGPTYELRYESLIADQANQTALLMHAAGLEMEAEQLRFHDRAEVSPTPSYAQVSEPLNDRSISRWRHFSRQLEPVRPLVREVMANNGYAD